jgi:hypothetical protein
LLLRGELRTQAWPPANEAKIAALVHGPENLLEPDIENNVASSFGEDRLFADGFEPSSAASSLSLRNRDKP